MLSHVQLCGPVDCSQLDFSDHGIFQAKILEWVAISYSRGPSPPRDGNSLSCYKVKSLSRVPSFGTPWTVACQAPPSMGFPRQEYWSGLPFPSPRDFLDPGIEPGSLTAPALAGRFFISSATWEAGTLVNSGKIRLRQQTFICAMGTPLFKP